MQTSPSPIRTVPTETAANLAVFSGLVLALVSVVVVVRQPTGAP